jgi:hypothetical protein
METTQAPRGDELAGGVANLDRLVAHAGQFTIGRVRGMPRPVAVACDATKCVEMLVQRSNESFGQLMKRLDQAIEDVQRGAAVVDEFNARDRALDPA